MINRRFKKLFLFIFFVCFLYFFVQFGFDQKDPNPKFGENLERNQIEKLKVKKQKKHAVSSETIGEAAIWNAIHQAETTTESHDDKILRDFLEGRRKKVDENLPKKNDEKITELKAESDIMTMKKIIKHKKKAKSLNHNKSKATHKVHKTKKKRKHDVDQNLIQEEVTTTDKIKSKPTTEVKSTEVIPTDPEVKPDEFFLEPDGPEPLEEKIKFGENGRAVTLPADLPDNIKQLIDDGWEKYQFNEYVSNLISVKRSLVDFRSDYCHDIHKSYMKDLPPVSVIIVFYNEAWSTLLRTIHSVIDRSPEKLINEILLVDDYSELPHLKKQLDDYVKKFSKVRLLRNGKREGLIRSRNRGATHAKSDILVFLDSHVECTNGWLEPLVDRIARNKTSIAVPIIEQINDQTFELEPRDRSHYLSLGGFGWNLQFRWFYMKSADRKHPDAPISSPTMAGGIFSVSTSFFKHVGMYDPGLELWGGENLELSFKTWMCGGHIQMVPCSHVGHVFRKKSPYKWPHDVDIFKRNCLRVANVWMDDYAKFYKHATGYEDIDYGDISERKQLRKNLNCKSFSWYLKNIYPERSIPSDQIAHGKIENLGKDRSMCIEGSPDKHSSLLTMFKCHGNGGSQYWEYNGEIYRDNHCITYDGHSVITKHCRKTDKQYFKYNPETKQLVLKFNNECLAMKQDYSLGMEKCDRKSNNQKWKLENLNIKKIEKL